MWARVEKGGSLHLSLLVNMARRLTKNIVSLDLFIL